MTPKQLQQHIANRTFLPVYLIFGKEEYFVERYVKSLTAAALEGADEEFNYDVLYGSEVKGDTVAAAANSFPVMADRRVVLVKEAWKLHGDPHLAGYLKNPSPDTVLILAEEEITKDKRKSGGKKKFNFYQHLSGLSEQPVVEFGEMREQSLISWIQDEFKERGKTISLEACARFLALKGSSAREIAAEVEKIAVARNDAEEIEVEDILNLLGASKKYNIFELSSKILQRDTKSAIEIAARLLQTENAIGMIAFMSRQFMILWRIKYYRVQGRITDADARAVGLGWRFQFEELAKHARNFSPQYFDRCFEHLLAADAELKSRPTAEFTVVSRLIYQLTAPDDAV
ncbi:MAG: DNA polymerase III subunit delta [Ectothiorhodospiraceae bacterium]|nr:DNA polymerase III subunit delta [Ectothiorhodospiraceae bacterium]